MRKLWAAFVCSARDRVRYRADVLWMTVFLLVLLFIYANLWKAVAAGDGRAGPYSVAQLLLYLMVAELVIISPANAHQRISEDVRSGEIAMQLLRPVGYVPWELAREAGAASVRVIALSLLGFPAVALLTGLPALDPRGVLVGLGVLVPLAILVECSVRILIGVLSFWLEDASPLYWIWQKANFVLGGLMIPIDMYPRWLARLAGLLPFQALLYGPARTVVAYDGRFALRAATALLFWAGLLLGLLQLAYACGRRRVQVNGG